MIFEKNDSFPTVAILMSTYNGERYISEQLESIFAQQKVNIELYVRDDGSCDHTLDIISKFGNVHLIRGKNLGCEASFMELLYMPIEADYYAFADQDDVWLPEKIFKAICNINEKHCDLSVCNLQLVDGNLHPMGILFNEDDIIYCRERMSRFALCNLHGCVQVWTNHLHKLIQRCRPATIVPHDLWVNAVANVVSNTYIDSLPYILYRLHGNNTSGYAIDEFSKIKKGVKLYLGTSHPRNDLLSKYLLDGYGDFLNTDSEKYKTLRLVVDYKKSLLDRIKLLFCDYISKASFQYRTLYRVMIMLNKF